MNKPNYIFFFPDGTWLQTDIPPRMENVYGYSYLTAKWFRCASNLVWKERVITKIPKQYRTLLLLLS